MEDIAPDFQHDTAPTASIVPLFDPLAESFVKALSLKLGGCVMLLSIDGHIMFASNESIWSSEGPVRGKRWSALWREESRPLIKQSFQQVADGQSVEFEIFRDHDDTSMQWWGVTLQPLADRTDGKVRWMMANLRDITAEVQMRGNKPRRSW